jgi:hypothetical protein
MTIRGRPFVKGQPRPAGAGRKAGSLNRQTVLAKGIIEQAAAELGGLQRLVEWVRADPKHEYAFWTSMFMRLLPVQDTGQDSVEEVPLTHEEIQRQLVELGLPPMVFGCDVPEIDRPVAGIKERLD